VKLYVEAGCTQDEVTAFCDAHPSPAVVPKEDYQLTFSTTFFSNVLESDQVEESVTQVLRSELHQESNLNLVFNTSIERLDYVPTECHCYLRTGAKASCQATSERVAFIFNHKITIPQHDDSCTAADVVNRLNDDPQHLARLLGYTLSDGITAPVVCSVGSPHVFSSTGTEDECQEEAEYVHGTSKESQAIVRTVTFSILGTCTMVLILVYIKGWYSNACVQKPSQDRDVLVSYERGLQSTLHKRDSRAKIPDLSGMVVGGKLKLDQKIDTNITV